MANLYRVRTTFTGVDGTPWYSNMYFEYAVDGASVVVDRVRDFWTGQLTQIHDSVTAVVDGDVAVVDAVTGLTVNVESTASLTIDFSAAGDMLPAATQMLIRWSTGLFPAGRQIQGKTFCPGHMEQNSTLGKPTAGLITAANVYAAALYAPTDYRFVIYSPKNGAGYRVVSHTVWDKWAVLRSRRD